MKVTAEEIEAKKTERGGWTKETLAGWDISWPPIKGWKESLISGEPLIPKPDPESHPDSIEAILLGNIVNEIISFGYGYLLADVKGFNKYYGGKNPTVAEVIKSPPILITGGIETTDKVFNFSVIRR